MAWHESQANRVALGAAAERTFDQTWICHCGGDFRPYGGQPGAPDRACSRCGQLVDVKCSPNGKIAIDVSVHPFDAYPNELILAALVQGIWRGCRRQDCILLGDPQRPKHKQRGTWYYRISLTNFEPLEFLLRCKRRLDR